MSLAIMQAQLGDREAARRSFDEALRAAGPDYLLVRVMRARMLIEDRRERIRELEAILAIPPERAPRQRLANEVARRRAARYLEEAEAKTSHGGRR